MSDSLLRVAFVNNSKDTPVIVHVVTQDPVEACQLLTTTPASQPQQNPGATQTPGGFDLEVGPGGIIGFITNSQVEITNPNSATVTTIYANGKDPWPQPPPPPPPGFTNVTDFPTRYNNFLMGGAIADASVTPVVMTLAAAPASP